MVQNNKKSTTFDKFDLGHQHGCHEALFSPRGSGVTPRVSHHRMPKLSIWLFMSKYNATNVCFIEFVWELNFSPKYTKVKLWMYKQTTHINIGLSLGLWCNLGAIYVLFIPFCGLRIFAPKVSLFSVSPLFNPLQNQHLLIQFNSSLNMAIYLIFLTSTQAVTALQCAPDRLALLLSLRFGVTNITGGA